MMIVPEYVGEAVLLAFLYYGAVGLVVVLAIGLILLLSGSVCFSFMKHIPHGTHHRVRPKK